MCTTRLSNSWSQLSKDWLSVRNLKLQVSHHPHSADSCSCACTDINGVLLSQVPWYRGCSGAPAAVAGWQPGVKGRELSWGVGPCRALHEACCPTKTHCQDLDSDAEASIKSLFTAQTLELASAVDSHVSLSHFPNAPFAAMRQTCPRPSWEAVQKFRPCQVSAV